MRGLSPTVDLFRVWRDQDYRMGMRAGSFCGFRLVKPFSADVSFAFPFLCLVLQFFRGLQPS